MSNIQKKHKEVEVGSYPFMKKKTRGVNIVLRSKSLRQIKNVEIEIGGQRIDKHYGDWLHIWNELTQTIEKILNKPLTLTTTCGII